MLKKIFSVLLFSLILLTATTNVSQATEAYEEGTATYNRIVNAMQGTWVANNGKSIVVKGNYFNNNHIWKALDMAGGGSNFGVTLLIDEGKNLREIRLAVQNHPEEGNATFSDGMLAIITNLYIISTCISSSINPSRKSIWYHGCHYRS